MAKFSLKIVVELITPPHIIIALLFCIVVNFAWGEVIDCKTQSCETKQGESKIFETAVEFDNIFTITKDDWGLGDIRENFFKNNGSMTFEKSVSFENTAIYYNSSNDFFDNNGIMTFKGNVDVRFENFINKIQVY